MVDWDSWTGDYGLIRDAISETYPEIFWDFNKRLREPGGFHRPIAARERKWNTPNGRANFFTAETLRENPDMPETASADTLQLMTTRGDSQFNTTVYGMDDRFRGVWGTRSVLFMNRSDMTELALAEGQLVTASTIAHDGIKREVKGLRATGFDIPAGCAAGYYPELNVLIPVWHCAEGSRVPAAKSIPIRLKPEDACTPA